MAQTKKEQTSTAKQAPKATDKFTFSRINYIYMLAGLALIVIGFLLMTGGGSNNPEEFNEAIFSFRRITLAPILILAGYVLEIIAIMKKPAE